MCAKIRVGDRLFFTHFMGYTGHIYVALGVAIERPSATHITTTMTLFPVETCSKFVERNNVHLIDVIEKLARNFINKT